ncbi:MAG: hypothetical protein ABTQ26_00910, partial [Azonexus sp.]
MPTVSPLFIDKIALTVALENEEARDRIHEWFNSDPHEVLGFQVSATRGGRFYWYSKEIVFNAETHCKLLAEYDTRAGAARILDDYDGDGESEPDIDIYAVTDSRRPFRIEWNPAQLLEVPEYQAAFVAIMQEWFGDALESEISNANITRIDLATDIWGININDIIAARADTTVISSGYGRDGLIQTIYLGGKNTDLRFVLYDKRQQLRGIVRAGQQARTRIEARIKQRLTFESLRTYQNPFERLTLREVSELIFGYRGNSPHHWDWFVDSCRQRGGEAALDLIRNSRTRRAWHNKVAMRDAPTWWDAQALWRGLREAIDQMGILPPRRRIRRSRNPY